MRKWAWVGAAALAVMTAGPVMAGNASGGGAQKAQLTHQSNSMDCPKGGPSTSNSAQPNGFAILNSTGKPLSLDSIVGEVSLKNGDPGATYTVFLQRQSMNSNNSCGMMVGTITTNGQGNGNAHVSSMETSNTDQYWIVLKET